MNDSSEIIGILGGIGPAATADFYAKLVPVTPAATDQEHPRTVIWSDPTVPDRTEVLLRQGPPPRGSSADARSCARRMPRSSPSCRSFT